MAMAKNYAAKFGTSERTLSRPMTGEELKKQIYPNFMKIRMEPKPFQREGNTGLCSASLWDAQRVSDWAAANDLPEVAQAACHHHIKGNKLLRTDALTLQRLGVCSGREALLAEEYICRLVKSVDHDASDNTGFPVEMHKSLYRGEATCPGYSPLDMLGSDPWVEHRLRFIDTNDHCTMRWMGLS